jgi:hypothetical protein
LVLTKLAGVNNVVTDNSPRNNRNRSILLICKIISQGGIRMEVKMIYAMGLRGIIPGK